MVLISQLATATCGRAAEKIVARAERSASRGATRLPIRWQPEVASRHWKTIVLHHSATASGDVATIDAQHRQRKDSAGKAWLGIGYHFVIGNGRGLDDGQVEPTFRWRQQLAGAHAGNTQQNDSGIGICLIGNFNDTEPTARQLAAIQELVTVLADQYKMNQQAVVRHLDVRATECPGRKFPFDQVVAPLPKGNSAASN